MDVDKLRKWTKSLAGLGLTFCVLVTLIVGALFITHPREWIDFAQVLFLVKQDFRESIDTGKMLDGAIAGLADAAEDKYTYYLTPERNKQAAMSAQGLTGGIGVTVGNVKEEEDRLLIREVRAGSGAAAAGLRADDAILRIDDIPVRDLTVDEAVAMVRGEPETYVRLLIARAGEDDKEYNVKRTTTITVDTVRAGFLKEEFLPGYKIAYILIDYFARNSGDMFNEQLDELLAEGAQGLIIDLRYNGGGDVAATVQIAGRLLPDGEVMTLVMRDDEQWFAIQEAKPVDIPYIVLVNGGSASASEILAGAIQDREGGILVGTRTSGMGSVQSVYTLLSGGGLRVTEGRYYLPSGRFIDGEGILPDYLVENDPEQADDDRQLQEALDLLREIFDGDETVATLLANSPLRQGMIQDEPAAAGR
jgi:carboxyl-terminal processing protease